jgi:hypothetical protein
MLKRIVNSRMMSASTFSSGDPYVCAEGSMATSRSSATSTLTVVFFLAGGAARPVIP